MPSATTTNEDVEGLWQAGGTSAVDRMIDGRPDDRVGSTGKWGHDGMDKDPVIMKC